MELFNEIDPINSTELSCLQKIVLTGGFASRELQAGKLQPGIHPKTKVVQSILADFRRLRAGTFYASTKWNKDQICSVDVSEIDSPRTSEEACDLILRALKVGETDASFQKSKYRKDLKAFFRQEYFGVAGAFSKLIQFWSPLSAEESVASSGRKIRADFRNNFKDEFEICRNLQNILDPEKFWGKNATNSFWNQIQELREAWEMLEDAIRESYGGYAHSLYGLLKLIGDFFETPHRDVRENTYTLPNPWAAELKELDSRFQTYAETYDFHLFPGSESDKEKCAIQAWEDRVDSDVKTEISKLKRIPSLNSLEAHKIFRYSQLRVQARNLRILRDRPDSEKIDSTCKYSDAKSKIFPGKSFGEYLREQYPQPKTTGEDFRNHFPQARLLWNKFTPDDKLEFYEQLRQMHLDAPKEFRIYLTGEWK